MFDLKKHTLFVLTILMAVALTACTLGQAAEPTPTPIDLDAVKTSAAATAYVELTQIAAAAPPTSTETPVPSETPVQTATNTPEGGVSPSETALTIGGGGSTPVSIPSFTPASAGGSTGGTGGPACKNSQYGGDITIPDGTVFEPWEKFTKAWTVKNTGICKWDEGFYFAGWAGPPSMAANQEPFRFTAPKDHVEPGGSVNIYIDMYAPGEPGEYVAHWAMYDDNGKQFGGDFTVVIKVVKD